MMSLCCILTHNRFLDTLLPQVRGVCCVHVIRPRQVSDAKYGYIYSADWPQTENRSSIMEYDLRWRPETCFIRLELLTLELAEKDGNCVHDR